MQNICYESDLGDGLREHLLQRHAAGATRLQRVRRHLDREGARLRGGVTLLGGDGDLNRHQPVRVCNNDVC